MCWLCCVTYNPLWSNAAYAISGMGILAVMMVWRRSRWTAAALTAFGILSFPLGIPAIFISRLRKRDTSA